MEQPKKIYLTPLQLKARAEKYCAYQERSHQQVRDKLYQLGGYSDDIENIIVHLIENNFLNEVRFVEAYVRGKFKMKGWGKLKIKSGLSRHRVSPKMMEKELAGIDSEEYLKTLRELLELKQRKTKEKNPYKRKAAMVRFASQRGFESFLIYEVLDSL